MSMSDHDFEEFANSSSLDLIIRDSERYMELFREFNHIQGSSFVNQGFEHFKPELCVTQLTPEDTPPSNFEDQNEQDYSYSDFSCTQNVSWIPPDSQHGNHVNICGNLEENSSCLLDTSKPDLDHSNESSIPVNGENSENSKKCQQKLHTSDLNGGIDDSVCHNDKSFENSSEKILGKGYASPKNKVGRKSLNEGFSKRKDVVFKSLLRKVRFHYKNEFKSTQDDSGQQVDHFLEMKAYLQSILGEKTTARSVFLFASIILPEDAKNMVKNSEDPYFKDSSLLINIDKILAVFYKFTLKKYKWLLAHKDISSLILEFLLKSDKEQMSADELIALEIIFNDCMSILNK